MADILKDIATAYGVGSYPPLNQSYLYAIADHLGVDTTTSTDLMADILTEVGGDPSTSTDYLQDIVLALGGTPVNGNYMEGWLAVAGGAGSAPVNTVLPVVTGVPIQGETFTTTDGTWTGTAPITFTYQWYNSNGLLSGETANTYVAQSTDVGVEVSCVVTATNAVGSDIAGSNSIYIYDTDYYAIYDGYLGTPCSQGQSILQNELMIALKAAGVWAKLDYLNVFATDGDEGFSTINWVTNTDTTSLGAFVTFTTNQGWTFPNDEYEFIDTGFQVDSGTNYQQDNASRYYFPFAFGASGGVLDCLNDGNGDNNRMEIGNFDYQTINTAIFADAPLNISSTVNAKSIHRQNSSSIRAFNRFTSTGQRVQNSQPLLAYTQIIGADNASVGSDNTVAGYALGASMVNENTDFVTAFDNYLSSL